jgi:hypothetical protein
VTHSVSFVIDAVPPSLNSWSRKHWSVRKREAAKWRMIVANEVRKLGIEGPISPAIVTLTFTLPRGGDAANREKFISDGLVGNLLIDDGPPHLAELRLRSRRGKPASTHIVVEAAGERG